MYLVFLAVFYNFSVVPPLQKCVSRTKDSDFVGLFQKTGNRIDITLDKAAIS